MAEMMDSITDSMEKGIDGVADVAANARARFTDAESQVRSLIQEYPLGALATAVFAGYVIARLAPRI